MSQSQTTVSTVTSHEAAPEDVQTVVGKNSIQDLLDALDDADCRAMIDATSDEALSAQELSDTCDLPLSTTYRKLTMLTDAELVEERTRIRRSGKHISEYYRLVEHVVLSIGRDGEMKPHVLQREDTEQASSSVSAMRE